MAIIKGASGFGDSIYMRPIMEWFIKNKPGKYGLLTNFPEIFEDLPIRITKFHSRLKADYHFTYVPHKRSDKTQFQDLIGHCGFSEIPIVSNLKDRKPNGSTVVIPPYPPMGGITRSSDMKPRFEEFFYFIKKYKRLVFIEESKPFKNLVDLFNSASLVITQSGWAVPLAQILDVPLIVLLTRRALNSSNDFISTIRPHKLKENSITKVIYMD